MKLPQCEGERVLNIESHRGQAAFTSLIRETVYQTKIGEKNVQQILFDCVMAQDAAHPDRRECLYKFLHKDVVIARNKWRLPAYTFFKHHGTEPKAKPRPMGRAKCKVSKPKTKK